MSSIKKIVELLIVSSFIQRVSITLYWRIERCNITTFIGYISTVLKVLKAVIIHSSFASVSFD